MAHHELARNSSLFQQIVFWIKSELVSVGLRERALSESDGPILVHGIEGMDKAKPWFPSAAGAKPYPAVRGQIEWIY